MFSPLEVPLLWRSFLTSQLFITVLALEKYGTLAGPCHCCRLEGLVFFFLPFRAGAAVLVILAPTDWASFVVTLAATFVFPLIGCAPRALMTGVPLYTSQHNASPARNHS
eukprot:RCo029199